MSTRPRVLTLSCPDRPGIVHAVTGALVALDANITESQQFGDPDSGLFSMRVAFDAGASDEALRANLAVVASRFDLDWRMSPADEPVRTLVMCSKQGHCLNDLLFRVRSGGLPLEVAAVVSNHTDLAPLADFYGVPFHHVPVLTGDAASKERAEARLLELVGELDVELVVLARYMQVLSDGLCRRLAGRAINIHHSFLPSFKGAKPYHQAHDRGVKIIGATAHYVTADLDEGPIIEQEVERVDHRHSPADLVRVGQDVEARTLARAVRWHAEQRVLLDGHRTVVFR
ncbi:formyltetrahydrofolate deformylase [Kineococcus terrestris]|uniref:formyltetrahydrofolate deformylase n=1 Tax=Kineococcus terrestris TaxID=2044856 RepID=UPI0034DAE9B1